jgi:hypothetical protein
MMQEGARTRRKYPKCIWKWPNRTLYLHGHWTTTAGSVAIVLVVAVAAEHQQTLISLQLPGIDDTYAEPYEGQLSTHSSLTHQTKPMSYFVLAL